MLSNEYNNFLVSFSLLILTVQTGMLNSQMLTLCNDMFCPEDLFDEYSSKPVFGLRLPIGLNYKYQSNFHLMLFSLLYSSSSWVALLYTLLFVFIGTLDWLLSWAVLWALTCVLQLAPLLQDSVLKNGLWNIALTHFAVLPLPKLE